MINFIKKILLLICVVFLFAGKSYGGEIMEAGSVLENDSYVFTIEEATRLKLEISKQEFEIERLKDLIEEYKVLDSVNQEQIEQITDLITIKDLQLSEYRKLREFDADRMKFYQKQEKFSKVEKWIFFGAGIGITVGSILIADKIDDGIESSPNLSNNISQSRTSPLFRF